MARYNETIIDSKIISLISNKLVHSFEQSHLIIFMSSVEMERNYFGN
jgi:hypothetical protein